MVDGGWWMVDGLVQVKSGPVERGKGRTPTCLFLLFSLSRLFVYEFLFVFCWFLCGW
jgi:hypothetical protein